MTPWPSPCTAPCLTGLSCASITPCSTRRMWGCPFRLGSWFIKLTGIYLIGLYVTCQFFLQCVVKKKFVTVFVHRSVGHFWIWRFCDQQLWAILHQLCQRAASVLLQSVHFHTWAGEITARLTSALGAGTSFWKNTHKAQFSFFKALLPSELSYRLSIKLRASRGKTLTTMTTLAASTSSAGSPLDSSTYWMRRASKAILL